MAGKSNIRSMRFSDTIIEMIEQQAGDTFTAKFEALVTKCVWELPKKEQELKEIQKQIDKKRDQLRTISGKAYDLEANMFRLGNAVRQYSNLVKSEINKLEKMCNTD